MLLVFILKKASLQCNESKTDVKKCASLVKFIIFVQTVLFRNVCLFMVLEGHYPQVVYTYYLFIVSKEKMTYLSTIHIITYI
jgi:hypothetical protein